MKKQGSSLARRKLNFKEKPWFDKIFFIDVRAENVKAKIAKRIQELGGRVEGFLTKEIHLLITDKTKSSIQQEKKIGKENQDALSTNTQNSFGVPLSRGRALLLKANQGKSQNINNNKNGNDIINNASLLGVKVQQVSPFLKETKKILQEFRQLVGTNEDNADSIDGVSPLRWKDTNKENRNIMKIEDSSQQFKPMLKHLDDFPLIRYSDQLVSPFDKGVTLCRKSEVKPHRYSTKTKTAVKVHKGGFCEACDYWYKCSLREHLNSEKHQKFVRDTKNFEKLDIIISKMPCLSDFIGKYLPGNSNLKLSLEENLVSITHGNKLDISNQNEDIAESVCIQDKMDVIVISNTDCEEFADVENVISGTPKSSLLLKNTSSAVVEKEKAANKIPVEESEMEIDTIPTISKGLLHDDSMDSGTGPEITNELSRDSIACIESLDDSSRQTAKSSFKRSNSDSALPPDVNEEVGHDIVMNSCSTNLELQDSSCDNTMFMCLTNSQSYVPVDQATTNVRKKLSSFSIHESSQSRDDFNLNLKNIGNETLQMSSQLIRTSCDILNSVLQEDLTNEKCDPYVQTDSEKTVLYDLNPECNKLEPKMTLLRNSNNAEDQFDRKKSLLDKFDFSPQKNELSNQNTSFVDVASHWMNDICGQDSVKKNDNDTLPNTIKFSKESSFNLDSENGSSVFKPVTFITCDIANTNKPLSEKKCEKRKIVNGPVFSDICGSETSEDVFPTIQNPFTLQNSELHSETSNMSNKSSVIKRPELSSTSSNISNLDTKSNDCFSLMNKSPVTPRTPSSFFRPWLEECGSENSISKSKRKKMNLSAADMGSLLKEVKKSTCKKNKLKGRRKPVEQIMNDNKNNKIVYSCQQNGTKLKISKVSSTSKDNQSDLHNYWKVRKSSGCRLVFSANKRKHSDTAEDEYKNDSVNEMPVQKRRRCLAF